MLSAADLLLLALAVGWVLLVGALVLVLVKVGRVLNETAELVSGVTDQTVPLLGEVTTTVSSTNAQLVRIDAITSNVQSVTTNASGLAAIFAATLGGPLVKTAAFTYGVRRALNDRRRGQITKRVRAEMKAERRAGRRRAGV